MLVGMRVMDSASMYFALHLKIASIPKYVRYYTVRNATFLVSQVKIKVMWRYSDCHNERAKEQNYKYFNFYLHPLRDSIKFFLSHALCVQRVFPVTPFLFQLFRSELFAFKHLFKGKQANSVNAVREDFLKATSNLYHLTMSPLLLFFFLLLTDYLKPPWEMWISMPLWNKYA